MWNQSWSQKVFSNCKSICQSDPTPHVRTVNKLVGGEEVIIIVVLVVDDKIFNTFLLCSAIQPRLRCQFCDESKMKKSQWEEKPHHHIAILVSRE